MFRVATLVCTALGLAGVPTALAQRPVRPAQVEVEGVVRNAVTGDPVAFAVVSVAGTNVSRMTDRAGGYRLTVSPGSWELRFRKIGFRMRVDSVTAFESVHRLDARLQPLPVELDAIAVLGEREDLATRIIRQAIARKNDVLARIHDYRYRGYIKFVVRDLSKDPDSTASVFMITETETTAYWEQPDRYQETITARRQSTNLDAENNLVSVGQIVNFNRNRIDLRKYSVVSPVADDALNHYRYHVADTVRAGGVLTYRLAVEPKTDARPLFTGLVDIADSTFDVLAVDVGANEAVRFEFFDRLRYRQRMGNVGADYWMPVEIQFSGEVHLGIPIPGFPEHLSFVHTAVLSDFRFDGGAAPRTLGEYLVVVDEGADDVDGTVWDERRALPLADVERDAYARIDSLERAPKPFTRQIASRFGQALMLSFNPDFFHFNRVEGAYLGAGVRLRDLSPNLDVQLKTGRAFAAEEWQHRFGLQVRVSEARRLWLGASYHDEIVSRPTVFPANASATQPALFFKVDPRDYYGSRGVAVFATVKLFDFTRLRLQYNDAEHSSRSVATDYSVFRRDKLQRQNPAIVDGRLRSLSAAVTLDSRPRLKRKGRDFVFNTIIRTEATLGVEYASPAFIANDFAFVRYFVRLHRRQRTLNMGLTSIDVFGGLATGALPPQRYFTVDFGNAVFFEERGFNTLDETNFAGDRAAMIYVLHDFDQQLFRRSRVPLLRDVPFTLSVHGGAFWTDFVNHTAQPGDELVATAPTAYGEIGFGLGNLTPMITPFNFAAWFTWQVSGYDTDRFIVRIGIP